MTKIAPDHHFKRDAILWGTPLILLSALYYACAFGDGYSNSGLLGLVEMLAWLGWFFVAFFALFAASIALAQKRWRLAVFIVGMGALSWSVAVLPSPFDWGYAAYVRHATSPKEIEEVAQFCLKELPEGGAIIGPNKGLLPQGISIEENKKLWEALAARHPFLCYAQDNGEIFVAPPTTVTFMWGGALPGHWGIRFNPQFIPGGDEYVIWRKQFSEKIELYHQN